MISSDLRRLLSALPGDYPLPIAVVISGSGCDASEGVQAVKAAGGAVLVQDEVLVELADDTRVFLRADHQEAPHDRHATLYSRYSRIDRSRAAWGHAVGRS